MRVRIFILFFIALIFPLPVVANAEDDATGGWTPFQLSILNPVQLFGEDRDVYGLRTSIFYGKSRDIYGLDLGLIHTTVPAMSMAFKSKEWETAFTMVSFILRNSLISNGAEAM